MSIYSIYITIILFFASAIYLLQQGRKYKRIVNALSKLQGPRGWFIVGNMTELTTRPEDFYETSHRLRKEYGPVYCLWFFNKPVVVISKAEYLEKILSSEVEIPKSDFYEVFHPWIGTGLFTASGSKWLRHRKMINPTFNFKMLESFLDVFVDKSEKLVRNLRTFSPGSEFDIYPLLHLVTLDIICETAMGVDVDAQQLNKEINNKCKDFVESHKVLTKLLAKKFANPWLYFCSDWIYDKFFTRGKQQATVLKTIHDYGIKILDERKSVRQQRTGMKEPHKADDEFGIKSRKCLLDVMLDANEEGSTLTNQELREEVDTFIFGGNDTTATTLAWCLLMLGNHQEVQDKVVEELNSIYEDTERRLTAADLVEMKYMERVIKETMRLYPAVPEIGRALKHELNLGDVVLPVGTDLSLKITTIHRDPAHFENPDVFNPDNFLPEKTRTRHPYAYLAFSAGPRNCIGQTFAMNEMKVVLATILRHFKVECVDKPEDVVLTNDIILKPKYGIKLRIFSRANSPSF